MFIPVIFVVPGGIMFDGSVLSFCDMINLFVFHGCSYPFVLRFSFNYPLWRWMRGNIYFNLVLSWTILVSPFMMVDSFPGYSTLGWQLSSLYNICPRSSGC